MTSRCMYCYDVMSSQEVMQVCVEPVIAEAGGRLRWQVTQSGWL